MDDIATQISKLDKMLTELNEIRHFMDTNNEKNRKKRQDAINWVSTKAQQYIRSNRNLFDMLYPNQANGVIGAFEDWHDLEKLEFDLTKLYRDLTGN